MNLSENKCIGLQAKWFRKSLGSSQIQQLKQSVVTAMKLRPNLSEYIVCIPHNLTSLRNSKNKTISTGEEGTWSEFIAWSKHKFPNLEMRLWDEHTISNLLQNPENEGRLRFWFERAAINPENLHLALEQAKEVLKDRYVPEVADDGDIALFLDNYFGTIESRIILIEKKEHEVSGHVDEVIKVIDRFRELPSEHEIRESMKDAFSFSHCLIIGEQGTGKTYGCIREAISFLDKGIRLPIFIQANAVTTGDGWREIIINALLDFLTGVKQSYGRFLVRSQRFVIRGIPM